MRKMMKLAAAALLTVSAVAGVHAQEDATAVLKDVCPHTDGEHYQANVFPRYELRNQRLVLVSWNTGKLVKEIQTSLLTTRLNIMNWSPDCRYLAGAVDVNGKTTVHIWDVVNAQVVGEFDNAGVRWSPDSQQAIISSRDGLVLWNVAGNSQKALMPFSGDNFISQWDADHNEVWILPYSHYYSADGVTVFDRSSGERVGYYDNRGGSSSQIGFTFAGDSKVLVYTVRPDGLNDAGVTIWKRGTDQHIDLNAGSDGTNYEARIALSPDAHYLAIGGNNLRVWDLTNLPAALADRKPVVYSGPSVIITDVKFVGDNLLQTNSINGSQQWDVATGEEVTSILSR
ncbi:MAG: WD40 repeat domain-containing protein [Anaerolineae bacterium]